MRKVLLSFVAVLAIGVVTGCGVPSWVQKDAEVYKGQASVGVYGVGEGAADLSREAQVDFASIRARTVLDKREKKYVASMLRSFVESHEDWFKVDQVDQMKLYSKAAEAVADETILDTRVVDQWTDEKGAVGDAGTIYTLRYLPLDSAFFDAVLKNYKKIIADNAEKVLKVKSETVMSGLKKFVAQMNEDPLMSTAKKESKKAAEKAKPKEDASSK